MISIIFINITTIWILMPTPPCQWWPMEWNLRLKYYQNREQYILKYLIRTVLCKQISLTKILWRVTRSKGTDFIKIHMSSGTKLSFLSIFNLQQFFFICLPLILSSNPKMFPFFAEWGPLPKWYQSGFIRSRELYFFQLSFVFFFLLLTYLSVHSLLFIKN